MGDIELGPLGTSKEQQPHAGPAALEQKDLSDELAQLRNREDFPRLLSR